MYAQQNLDYQKRMRQTIKSGNCAPARRLNNRLDVLKQIDDSWFALLGIFSCTKIINLPHMGIELGSFKWPPIHY